MYAYTRSTATATHIDSSEDDRPADGLHVAQAQCSISLRERHSSNSRGRPTLQSSARRSSTPHQPPSHHPLLPSDSQHGISLSCRGPATATPGRKRKISRRSQIGLQAADTPGLPPSPSRQTPSRKQEVGPALQSDPEPDPRKGSWLPLRGFSRFLSRGQVVFPGLTFQGPIGPGEMGHVLGRAVCECIQGCPGQGGS